MRGNRVTKKSRASRGAHQSIDPPSFSSVAPFTKTYRFFCNTSFAGTITNNDLISVAGGIVSVANTTVAPIAVSFKVHKVRIWGAPATAGAGAQISIRWNTESNYPMKELTNTSMSTARPAYLEAVPPKGSEAWLPQGPASSGVFGLAVPAGGIIEIHMTHWFYDTGAAPVGTFTITVATAVGIMQYGYLDQTGSKYLQPVGLPPMT